MFHGSRILKTLDLKFGRGRIEFSMWFDVIYVKVEWLDNVLRDILLDTTSKGELCNDVHKLTKMISDFERYGDEPSDTTVYVKLFGDMKQTLYIADIHNILNILRSIRAYGQHIINSRNGKNHIPGSIEISECVIFDEGMLVIRYIKYHNGVSKLGRHDIYIVSGEHIAVVNSHEMIYNFDMHSSVIAKSMIRLLNLIMLDNYENGDMSNLVSRNGLLLYQDLGTEQVQIAKVARGDIPRVESAVELVMKKLTQI